MMIVSGIWKGDGCVKGWECNQSMNERWKA